MFVYKICLFQFFFVQWLYFFALFFFFYGGEWSYSKFYCCQDVGKENFFQIRGVKKDVMEVMEFELDFEEDGKGEEDGGRDFQVD